MVKKKSNKLQLLPPAPVFDVKTITGIAEAARAGTEKVQSLAAIAKSSQNIFANLADSLMPQMPDPLATMDTSWITESMNWKAEKEAEEAEVRRLQLLKLRRELYPDKSLPRYDPVDCIIRFLGKVITIPQNTNQEMLCKVVLRNRQSMAKKWSWDEIVEAWHEEAENYTARKVYTAARDINDRVAKKTAIEDFFVITMSTTQLNPKFFA